MSGTYCEGCGEGSLVADPAGEGPRAVMCDLCGWKAPDGLALPRKWMRSGTPRTKRARKQAGRLFFLWLDFDPDADGVTLEVMRVLGLRGMTRSGARSLIELETKPSPETLDRLRALSGVTRVFLAP